jgi:acetyl-CoA carboxylase beta subunit
MRSTVQKRVSELPGASLAQRCPSCGQLTLTDELCETVGEASVCMELQSFVRVIAHEQVVSCPPGLGEAAEAADPAQP